MHCIEYLFYVGANNNEEKFLDLKIYETIKLVRGWKLHQQIAASRLVWPSQAARGEKNTSQNSRMMRHSFELEKNMLLSLTQLDFLISLSFVISM